MCSAEIMQVAGLYPESPRFPGLPPVLGSCLLLPHVTGAPSGAAALIAPSVQGAFANISAEHQPWRGTSPLQVVSVSESIKELHSAGSAYSSVYEFYLHVISTLSRI